jgi:hypothetical protein
MENRSVSKEQGPIKTPEREVLEAYKKALEKYGEKSPETEAAVKKSIRAVALDGANEKEDFSTKEIVLRLAPESHDKQMEELISILQTKGLKQALKVLYKLNSFHLEDDFHRFLVQYLKAGYGEGEIKERSRMFQVLRKTLYEVSLPFTKDSTRSFKEIISGMEQFYSGMLSIYDKKLKDKNSISFEIALPHIGEEVSFFVAIPDESKSLFEKQLLSIFTTAKIQEVTDDYNIFNDKGFSVGSYAKFKKSEALSLKTYESFDHDPLNVIVNSFSKLQKEGEGAALQILFSPAEEFYYKRYSKALEKLQKGTRAKEALQFDDGIWGEVMAVAKDIFTSSKKEEKDETTANDGEAIENVKRKLASPIVSTNIRLVVSAPEKNRASSILRELQSAFNQFEDTSGNSLKFEEPKGRHLTKLLRAFSYRDFNLGQTLPLNLKELTSMFHFSEATIETSSNVKQSKSNTAPAPVDLPTEGLLMGTNSHRNEEKKIYFATEDRLRHFYTIGQTGTGKTSLLKNMIIQDIKNGEGVCMIDPHGSDIQEVLANIPPHRKDDLIYFDPSNISMPMGLNMMEYDPRYPEQKTFVVNEMLSIFNKLFNMEVSGGPAFEQYFRNSALLVLEHPESGNTVLDIGRVLSDRSYRELKLSHCKNPTILQFWQNAEKTTGDQGLSNYVQYVTNKFDVFVTNDIMRPIITQQKSAFNFREIMDNKKILLVNLAKGRLGDINSSLIGLIIVGKILMAALSRVDSYGQDLPPFYLYIDEFQNVTTPSISIILSEARKYKLSLNIAHQFIAQLDDNIKNAVFGNVGSMAVFRVGADDAAYLEKQFEPVFSALDMLNVDNFNSFVKMLSHGRPTRPFSMRSDRPEVGNKEQVEQLKELSALKYGRPIAEIEADIRKKYGI